MRSEAKKKNNPTVLVCACCGRQTMGRQWFNQDKGYGLCHRCSEEGRFHDIAHSYGVEGINYAICRLVDRHGKVHFEGSHNDCLAKLHKVQSCSWHHAMKHEGWKIVKVEPN